MLKAQALELFRECYEISSSMPIMRFDVFSIVLELKSTFSRLLNNL